MSDITFVKRIIGSVHEPRLSICAGKVRPHDFNPADNRCYVCKRDVMNVATEAMFEVTDTVEVGTGKILFRSDKRPLDFPK